ncbi:hypothetical protein Nepgr_021330 [Nepenthes gracilis]|uniref:Uncharacterized protein n=1 Tax=Nepenthes gracilis TaxID=150966 RepID=A0AAD3SZB6_NEPGR|nr:hypothetical protein Nepgr_021330 [Nepenthes gracilis]
MFSETVFQMTIHPKSETQYRCTHTGDFLPWGSPFRTCHSHGTEMAAMAWPLGRTPEAPPPTDTSSAGQAAYRVAVHPDG